MYVCMYVCMYACMYVCMYVYWIGEMLLRSSKLAGCYVHKTFCFQFLDYLNTSVAF
jgi:hypothetical protein